jgi:DNA-binding LytR/AlgR family response regulator
MSEAPTAVVADDEPLLAQSLIRELAEAWPELQIIATAANGKQAIADIHEHQPDVAFLDIRMPGHTGIEVAQSIAEDWPDDGQAPPRIVFVTAFDDYAVDAFSAAAIDYLLKPVKPERLATTVTRLRQQLENPTPPIDELGAQIRQLLTAESATDTSTALRTIRASVKDIVKMIPVNDVILFESSDKYVTVFTETDEALIREPLRKLLPQLDQNRFAQIHRGAIVNLDRVEAAVRDDTGKITLRLRGHNKKPAVSRIYRHLFQAM